MDNTKKLNLKLPASTDYVDIEVLNENFRKIDASASSLEVTLRIEADETTVVAVSHSSGTYSGISTFSCAISSGSVSPSFTSFFSPATVINIFFSFMPALFLE